MRPSFRVRGPLALALMLGAAAHAGEPLGWAQAVELAAQHNPELRGSRESLRAAEFQASGAYAGYLPQVSGSLAYSDTRVGEADSSQYSTALSATQNLFAGFRDQGSVAQAGANRDAAAEALAVVRARVSFDLKSAYAQLRYSAEGVRLAEDIVRRREENLRLVQLRFEGGRENQGSVALSRAQFAQARLDLLLAEQAVEAGRTQLARVLGLAPAPWDAIDSVPVAAPAAIDLERAVTETPEHRQALAQERAAAAGVQVARAGLLPSLNLTGSIGRIGESWAPQDESRSVGMTLAVPLYSGGRDYYATRSAGANFGAAQANREAVERQTRARIKQAHNGYVQAVERLAVDEEFVQAAAMRAEIARSKYDNGLLSFEDWDLIENDLVNRQKARLVSVRDRVIAEATFEQAIGSGVIP